MRKLDDDHELYTYYYRTRSHKEEKKEDFYIVAGNITASMTEMSMSQEICFS